MDDDYRPKVKEKKSSAGIGLFAQEDISKGQLIIEYTGERISVKEADKRGGRYLFGVTPKVVIDGSGKKNKARYINHSCKPNAEAEHETTEDRIYIRSIKKIKKGEEITYDYGPEYVNILIKKEGCRCASCIKKAAKKPKKK